MWHIGLAQIVPLRKMWIIIKDMESSKNIMNYNEVGVYSKVGRNIESDELWVSQL